MKKILTLFLSAVLILSCLTVPAFSAESEYASAEEMEILRALGIVSDDVQNGAHITRGEAAKYFCRMLNIEIADPTGFESVFYDVTSETPYYKYISTICRAGFMQGDGNGRFRPNAPISTMEATRVLTSLIGYKGYIAVSNIETIIGKTDVLEGVSIVSELEYGQFFKMIYNILHAPACRETGYGTTISFEISNDYLGMEYLFKVAKARGIVEEIKSTSLTDGGSRMHDGNIAISGNVYGYTDDAEKFLGYSVDYYYRTDVDSHDIVYIAYSDKNKIFELNYDEIIRYSNFEYEYEYKNSSKTVKISPETDVLFNGVACMAPSDEDMVPKFGKVKFVSNDGDNTYDVVVIDSYEFMVVDTINKTKEIIKDKESDFVLDYHDADEIIVTNNGNEYSIDRIYTGNLLKIKRSKAESGCYKIVIDVNKEDRTVAITGVSQDEINASGEKFPIWDNIDETSKETLKIGKTATIYIADGMIVRAIEESSSQSYGYLLAISEPELFGDILKFRIILPDLSEMIVEKNKKIKIDGVVMTDVSEIENALLAGAANSVAGSADLPLAQPIKYTLSKDGILTSIDTLYFNGEAEDAETSLRRVTDGTKFRYRSYNNSMYLDVNTFIATTSTFMGVPVADRGEAFNYRKTAPSSESKDIAMDICSVDADSKTAEIVFYYNEIDTIADDYGMHIVAGKSTELNAEGEVVDVLKLYNGGSEYNRIVSEDIKHVFDDLEIGDIISYDMNGQQKITIVKRESSLSTMLTDPPARADRVGAQLSTSGKNNDRKPPYDGGRILYGGTALDITMGKILYTPSMINDIEGFDANYMTDSLVASSAVVYKYSIVRGEPVIEQGTLDDIVTYKQDPAHPSAIVVYINSNTVRHIFVVDAE